MKTVSFDFELLDGTVVYVKAKQSVDDFILTLENDSGEFVSLAQLVDADIEDIKERAEEVVFFKTQELDFRD